MKKKRHHRRSTQWDRRSFLQKSAAGGLGVALRHTGVVAAQGAPRDEPVAFENAPRERVRIGFVGVGLQGTSHVRNLLRIENAEIRAVCDVVEWKVERIQDWVEAARRPRPDGYTRGERDYERLCERDDLDLIITVTPWKWHVPICVAAMRAGKHAATEVPAAVTLEECWELVETSEQTRRHCVMLENCCYSERALLTLNLVRRGLLGEIVNGAAGYMHDLRRIKFNGKDEALWRTAHSVTRNGNIYPTHAIGPLSVPTDVNRGDRLDHLVSMSSNSRGLNLYATKHLGPDDPLATQSYALGDVNTTMIRTVNGVTLSLVHDTSTPRPYSRIDRVQGTRGVIEGYPDRVYIDERSRYDQWETFDDYLEEHGHALWKMLEEQARGAGHGGMDFLEDYRLIDALAKGRYPDMDVYDAATWSAISELSEQSVANRARTVDVPDFTRGAWKTNPRIFVTDL